MRYTQLTVYLLAVAMVASGAHGQQPGQPLRKQPVGSRSASLGLPKAPNPPPTLVVARLPAEARTPTVVPEPVAPPTGVAAPAPHEAGAPAPPAATTSEAQVVAPCNDACCPVHGCCRHPGMWQTRIKPCLQESHWGYADLFEETPFGASVRAHMRTQICNGTAARLVLYRYDFCDAVPAEAFRLNPHGARRLQEMAMTMQSCSIYPLVIEATPGDPALDAARRDHVLKLVRDHGFALPDEWIVVGELGARGLSGEEAFVIQQKMLRQTVAGESSSVGAGPIAPMGVLVPAGNAPAGP